MAGYARVPVTEHKGEKWGDLNSIDMTHEVCGENVKCITENFSFKGGHRVRLFRFKKNVYWRLPSNVVTLDISGVTAGPAPRKRP